MTDADDGKMGIWMTTALVIGSMIGSGIFLLPVSLAPLGVNGIVGWGVSGIGAVAIALALGRLARDGAGIQAAIEARFGSLVAYLVTFAFWCSSWTAVAALGIATASALSWLDPGLQTPAFTVPVAICSVLVLALVNSRGVRASGSVSIVTDLIKVLPLLAVVIIAISRQTASEASPQLSAMPLTTGGLASAVALTLFALTGFENATAPVDKVRDARRTIPRALIAGVVFVALLYFLSSTAVLLVLSGNRITASAAPFADVIALQWGHQAAIVAAGGIAVAAFGSLNCNLLAAGELAYSMALRRELPVTFAATRHGTPVAAHWLSAGLAILLILSNASRATANLFTFVILLSTVSVLVLYVVASLALWERGGGAERVMILLAIAFCLFAFWGAGIEADAWGIVLLAAGYVLRLLMRGINSRASTIPPAAAS